MLSIFFHRHGQTDWNLEHRAMGNQDVPRNDLGFSHALKASKFLKNETITAIIAHTSFCLMKVVKIGCNALNNYSLFFCRMAQQRGRASPTRQGLKPVSFLFYTGKDKGS